MQVEISCRHGSVQPDVQEYIKRKSEKLLTFFERVTSIRVTVDFLTDLVKTEILVDAEHKHNFVAASEASDTVSAYDLSYAKMEQQIRKYKEKVQDHRRDKPLRDSITPVETDEEE